jgi:SAM-dependent methyltransferase
LVAALNVARVPLYHHEAGPQLLAGVVRLKSSEIQGKLWGAQAQDWADLFEPAGTPLWEAMLDSAEVRAGTRFLDVGCGGGGASLLAARRGASIAGLDPAEALVGVARVRVREGDFRVGDIEEMPYETGSFEVVFASLVLMFAANPNAALRELRRVCIPSGRVTIGIWGNLMDCDYRHVLSAVASLAPIPPASKGPFALSGDGVLESIVRDAGLRATDKGEVMAPFVFADDDMMWRTVRSAGPIQAAMQTIGEDQVKAAVLRAAKPFRDNTGRISMSNRFRYLTAMPQ